MIFTLEKTKRTPSVELSEKMLVVKGECYPENIAEFSEPIMENVQAVLDKAQVFDVIFELIYFNSSSAKFLFDFFEYLEESAESGREILIQWCYRREDDTMLEAGEDFQEDVESCTYELVAIETEAVG